MEDEIIQTSKFNNKLVKISCIEDNNNLLHSVLKGCYVEYRKNANIENRKNICKNIRQELGDSITKINHLYSKKDDVISMVKNIYKTEEPLNFIKFLNIAYDYQSPYISFPIEPKFSDEIYVEEYKSYILSFYEKITNKLENDVIFNGFGEKIENNDDFNLINKAYQELTELVNYEISILKHQLEEKVGDELYLPTNFNQGVIEAILNNEAIPEGKYKDYDFNCFLFTVCSGINLKNFNMEYYPSVSSVCLADIQNHFRVEEYLDEKTLSFIPELMGINLILIDFNENKFLKKYENFENGKFVILHNSQNFETVGIKNLDDNIITFFDKNHPFILSLKNENEHFDFSEEEKSKIVNFKNGDKIVNENIIDKIKKELGDKVEISQCNTDLGIAYIRYHQTPKTIYRFYINEIGDITSGNVPNKIKNIIKKCI